MATENQNEPQLPLSNKESRKTVDLLPRFYRTNSNKKFLASTLDQLVQPGTVKKVAGFIGRKNAKSVKADDIFLKAASKERQDYQLEPAAVIQDYLGNTNFFKDYLDHINHVEVFGGNIANHERLNKQEFYSWNPHIDFDKFVNFQQYYWLPYGPEPIEVLGQQVAVDSTFAISLEDQGDNIAFLFNEDVPLRNPTITLYRGQTYNFDINTPFHPFSIKTERVSGEVNRYTNGVSAVAVQNGTITFTVPYNAPDVLYYVSEGNADTGGEFHVKDIADGTFLDVEADIISKKTYTMSNGVALSNGMKLKFRGEITPAKYAQGFWYVEGVGSAIKLVAEKDLEIVSSYSETTEMLFDDDPFDAAPFSTVTTFPREKDYIVVNRASPDRNPWARYNRWFHHDVIVAAAKANGQVPNLDQSARATRPIIEFEAGLKLFNCGHQSKANVDLIDTYTKDVFSTIEGSLGYNIDGVDLAEGMRVLFTADPDRLVKDKIFKVTFVNVTVANRQVTFDGATAVDPETDVITFATPHKLITGNQVLYLNNSNTSIPGLTNRKSYHVQVIDDYKIALFANASLTVRVDLFGSSSGTHKLERFTTIRRQINLVEEADSAPKLNETVLVNQGNTSSGVMYWYNGATWKKAQVKTDVNQAPLFDVFDAEGNSFGSTTAYDGTSFVGTKVFSYKVGNGSNDSVLGFPLTYQNISNIGDIVFDFNLLSESFNYKEGVNVIKKNLDVGYVRIVKNLDLFDYENAWTTSEVKNTQPIVRIFKDEGLTNDFPIDVFDNKDNLADLEVRVYVNGVRLDKGAFEIKDGVARKFVHLTTDVGTTDVVTLRCFAVQPKNENGHYETPLSLQNNPLNQNVSTFTLGEVINHVDSIIDNISNFAGQYPGNGNLRDLGNIVPFGTKFVQHSGPMNLSLYHLGSRNANVFRALEKARADYGKFKRAFVTAATESGIDTDARRHVDFILKEIGKDKTKTQPYYLSDMFGSNGGNRLEFIISDEELRTYPLTELFNLESLSSKSVNIYLNEEQLLHGRDYVFGTTDAYFTLLVDLEIGDVLEVFEYESTDGCYCPPTPTKLGLYPLYEPKRYIDDTYLEPVEVIQGHDGSITVAYGDYRDDLILELEKRIFNNVKIKYDPSIFDIADFVPGYSRKTAYTRQEFENVMSQCFFQWASTINIDYTKHEFDWDRLNAFTFNFRDNFAPDGSEVPAFWRGIYRWFLDTDRPHTNPWECLGFSIKPQWWEEVYGPAPYTSDNLVLWNDIRDGIIREPNTSIKVNPKYAKGVLAFGTPVDDCGNLVDPLSAGYLSGFIRETEEGYFTFGDVAPAESAWRRSSYFPFAILQTALLLQPNRVLGTCLDRSRIVRNQNSQLVYSETNLRIRLEDLVLPSTALSAGRVHTSGLINYVVDYLVSDTTAKIDQYAEDLRLLQNKIGSKLGGFTSKPKMRLILDSKSPTSSGGVFIPEENYNIVLNVSSPIEKVTYSGVVITKHADGYEVRGYSVDQPYFISYPHTLSGRTINVGGISESFLNWSADSLYVAGKIVRVGTNAFYRVKITHTSGSEFDETYFARLPALPVTGGRDAILRKGWDTDSKIITAYGTKFKTVQEVVDFLQGYGAYLESKGFIFDEYNTNLKAVSNWETSIKEFLFWTTQTWKVGSVLSLSPAANGLYFKSVNSVVNNINDPFYEYSVVRVDGKKLEPDQIAVYRENNDFSIVPERTNHGIFGVTLYLVEKEHVLLLDNTTMFNDVIYDLAPGYRQEKIKVLGYMSDNWNGGFTIPGFIYDQARLNDWTPWKDYNLGDIVKYKEFYYTAKQFLPGTEEFEQSNWIKLEKKPEPALLPNWEYKAEQFTDFYDLDTDNFDSEQQRLAQHLIGYQKREYLENIINDDVSQYKFYQGMIAEKGTQNVFSKLFDVLSSADQESLSFNEEWAIRVGNYGAIDSYQELEFNLDEKLFKLTPQPFEFTESTESTFADFVYRLRGKDLSIKPVDYNGAPWSTEGTKKYLRTPGYVRYEDVDVNVDSITDLVGMDIADFEVGHTVWCAFENRDWNVYRMYASNLTVTAATYTGGVLTLSFSEAHNLNVGDVVGIKGTAKFNGFYKITSVDGDSIGIQTTIAVWETVTAPGDIEVYDFLTARVDSIDNLEDVMPTELLEGELLWTDAGHTGNPTIYKHAPVFTGTKLESTSLNTNLDYGTSVAMANDASVLAVSQTNGTVSILVKDVQSGWAKTSELAPDLVRFTNTLDTYGTVMAFSPNGEVLAVAAPAATNVNGSGLAQQGTVDLYQHSVNGSYAYIDSFVAPTPAANEKFGSTLSMTMNTAGEYFLYVGAPGSTNSGKVYIYKGVLSANGAVWTYNGQLAPTTPPSAGDKFGSSIHASPVWGKIAVAASGANTVFVFDTIASTYEEVTASYNEFGTSVAVADSYLAVGASDNGAGLVAVFKHDGTSYVEHQEIVSRFTELEEGIDTTVFFQGNSKTLVMVSYNGTGRVEVFDRYLDTYVYGETLNATDASEEFAKSVAVADYHILVGAPQGDGSIANQGVAYVYEKGAGKFSWMIHAEQLPRPNVAKVKKTFLYDTDKRELIAYLDVVDATQGKIPGPADQEIKFKTYFDPAVYSTGTASVVVDEGMNWTKPQVGVLWWDLTRAKFLENQLGSTVYSSSTWNVLYETGSIDIYEWIESKYLPSERDKLVGTDAGNAAGISGLSKYGDAAYSIKRRYDPLSQQFQNTYFYWVKNPTVIPNAQGRSLSAFTVSRLISDPVAEGYPCVALTGTNTFSLVNVVNLIDDTRCNINFQYWIVDQQYTEVNAHSQWKIISENENSVIPKNIEEKWIDSLIGKDSNNRVVPDIDLPVKNRYGIQFRPRQSMFVNRVEALKQYIERVNAVLAKKLIADDFDLSDLFKEDPQPTAITGAWDTAIDTELELRFVGTASLVQAEITPIIEDGRIVDIGILNPGYGYANAPFVQIDGVGINATLQTVIDGEGRITGVNVLSTGEGYLDETVLTVRPFSVLVKSDSNTFNKWSIYSWNKQKGRWDRVKSQTFNVNNYWSYMDWYSEGYNQFTKVTHVVDNTYQLSSLVDEVGDIVKVKNIGTGGWLLLEKIADIETIEYTEKYKVVGREKGTIQFDSALYDYRDTTIGYDTTLYDSVIYDNLAIIELRLIINAIKDKILVDDLRGEYLKLFFASVRYALHEQPFIDWAFKTSFVKAKHHVGELSQRVTYKNDNLSDFEDYFKEVKPYRTQVREYVSAYSKVDNAHSAVSDFDVMPMLAPGLEIEPLKVTVDNETGEIIASSSKITANPWKNWLDNVGFTIQSIELVDGGSGYIANPVVKIEGGFGTGAVAKAYVANGKVNRIQLVSPGTRFLKAPTITIEGGLADDGVPATAVAIIESEVVRANKITMKFDRTSKSYNVSSLTVTETFTGTGSRLQFALKFSPVTKIGASTVKVDGVNALRESYSLSSKKSTSKGYTTYSGVLTMETAPAAGATVTITYQKDFYHLTATDRINFYYDPETGMLGKDLAQLMTGVDYGGVIVTGLGFGANAEQEVDGGWDKDTWFDEPWDTFDETFLDYTVPAQTGVTVYQLPFTPAAGVEINIYINGVRVDPTTVPTFVGNGTANTVSIAGATFVTGDTLKFVQSTSDGTFEPQSYEYDTQLSGGDLAYTTATGVAPDDIVIDGDGFVTPTSSHAPEEVVPGHVSDAVAIKVFQLPTSEAPRITVNNYFGDGGTTAFTIGQIPNNIASVFVKVDNIILTQGTDFEVEFATKEVILTSAPAVGAVVQVIAFGVGAKALLDSNYFVADGATTEYLTNAVWTNTIGSTVLVDGEATAYEIFKADAADQSVNRVGIRFSEPVTAGSLITYAITSDENEGTSVIKKQTIVPNGTSATFALTLAVGEAVPYENSVIVIKNGEIMTPANADYFTLSGGQTVYALDPLKSPPHSVDPTTYRVYLNGDLLSPGADYFFDVAVASITIRQRVYVENGVLAVVNFADTQYTIENGQITFSSVPLVSDKIEFVSMYNHDVLNIIRTTEQANFSVELTPSTYEYRKYNLLMGKSIPLFRTVSSDDYVWIIKNGKMLSHSVDFYLDSDLTTVRLMDALVETDVLDVMLFSDRTVALPYGFMQFKDMLNRVHFKRINRAKSTTLAQDLKQKDTDIVVVDGSVLDTPNAAQNIPGVVEIYGERIEYLVKTGNTLSQLRRGTLGTGVRDVHVAGTIVQDMGANATIPYTDKQVVHTFIGDGATREFDLSYVPVKADNEDWFADTIPSNYGQTDEIEVFVGGLRLRKAAHTAFVESNGEPYSPEGDSTFESEFSVDGVSSKVRLTAIVPEGVKVVVVKRVGKVWEDPGTSFNDSNNKIVNFVKDVEATFPQYPS